MEDIKQYFNTKTAFHCETEEESDEINKLIIKHGGKNSLHRLYKVFGKDTCYSLEYKKWITFESLDYFLSLGYKIIKAKDILKENKMKHTFKNGTTLEGDFSTEQLKEIAKIFGESLYPIYQSKSLGNIPVDEMHNNHLTNCILLHLREYYVQSNFKGMDLVDFKDCLTQYDNVTRILFEELDRRIKNEKI